MPRNFGVNRQRFHSLPRLFGVALKKNYKHMKSSMTYPSHTGMIIIARFHPDTRDKL